MASVSGLGESVCIPGDKDSGSARQNADEMGFGCQEFTADAFGRLCQPYETTSLHDSGQAPSIALIG